MKHEPWWIAIIEALIIINLLLGLFAYLTLIERKVMGRMQLRYGPNRAGPFVVAGAGHFLQWERAQLLNDALRLFLL